MCSLFWSMLTIQSLSMVTCHCINRNQVRNKRSLQSDNGLQSVNIKHNGTFEITPFTVNELWPRGVIPFKFSHDYGSPSLRRRVLAAMRSLEEVTCVRFLPVKQDYQDHHTIIIAGVDCSSFVGRQLSMVPGQNMSLPSWCLDRPEGALHELLHLLGFGHEQTRPDRDKFVAINWQNIPSKYWFTFEENADAHYYLGYRIPYDFASILHYGPYDFAKNKLKPTLVSKKSLFWVRSNRKLSRLDAVKINSAYNCTAHLWREERTCKDYLAECPYMATDKDCAESTYLREICHKSCKQCTPQPLYWPIRKSLSQAKYMK